jgi:hypothetical protein
LAYIFVWKVCLLHSKKSQLLDFIIVESDEVSEDEDEEDDKGEEEKEEKVATNLVVEWLVSGVIGDM